MVFQPCAPLCKIGIWPPCLNLIVYSRPHWVCHLDTLLLSLSFHEPSLTVCHDPSYNSPSSLCRHTSQHSTPAGGERRSQRLSLSSWHIPYTSWVLWWLGEMEAGWLQVPRSLRSDFKCTLISQKQRPRAVSTHFPVSPWFT